MHPKGAFSQARAVLGSIRRAGRCCGQGTPVCIPLPKSNGFESRTKVETLPKSKWCPLPKSRMILREKTSGKVELGLYYALLFHDSGIHPVILTICMDICFNRWFLDWTIIRVDGSFLMMTASCSRYSLLSFPLLGFIPLYFPAFLGFTAAFNRHFRAGFRLYYGI